MPDTLKKHGIFEYCYKRDCIWFESKCGPAVKEGVIKEATKLNKKISSRKHCADYKILED